MRILIAATNAAASQSLELHFKSEGLHPFTTDCEDEALDLAKRYDYDLLIIDYEIGDTDGITLLRRVRREQCTTPIITLVPSHLPDMLIACLEGGADDCLLRPFNIRELLARMRTVTRRPHAYLSPVISLGTFTLDHGARELRGTAVCVRFTQKELGVLECLASQSSRSATREKLLGCLYGDEIPESNVLDRYVASLRKKLMGHGVTSLHIDTIHASGYRLRIDP